jgi:hypothetical protein
MQHIHGMPRTALVPIRWLAAAPLAVALATASPAHAEGKLEARYAITAAGINVGQVDWTVDIGSRSYKSSASGRASGILSALLNGEGAISASGAIRDGQLAPEIYRASVTRDNDKSETRMVFDGGDVKSVEPAAEKFEAPDRLPIKAVHRQGVVDPASAMLIAVPGASTAITRDACQRTLPIFDGRRRYDITLAFKRTDRVKAARGYAGPVAVCSVAFKPQAGHRASSKVVTYLAGGHEIELWLAPLTDARLFAPFRASIASMFGSLVVEATQFDVMTRTAAR